MSDLTWVRKDYQTWDEAFRGLTPINRQQSVRVAEYTREIFLAACQSSYRKGSMQGDDEIRGQFADVAYKCGLYHQLGKSLVPPEYQTWQKDFSEEEKAVYRKYTTDGRLLVADLQERGVRAKEKRTGVLEEVPTKNIPWLMIRESCEQHMERFDGSGFPRGKNGGRSGTFISPIATIVGFAKELDRLSAEMKLERPFDYAVKELEAGSGTLWDPDLVAVFKKCEDKCRAVYEKYIYYTLTLPETIPLVVKREDRPMGLKYRPMIGTEGDRPVAYEAIPWFGGIAGRPGETEPASEVEEMLKRTELLSDVAFYLMYEAADMILRLTNCGIGSNTVLIQQIPLFYRLPSQLQRFQKLFEDQPIPKEKLMMTIPEEMLMEAPKSLEETVSRYIRNGIVIVLDGFHPGKIEAERLKELGFVWLRLASDACLKQETANEAAHLAKEGFRFMGAEVDDENTLLWLRAAGTSMISGPITGKLSDEDEVVRDELFRNQN
ncbi:MAG: EAL domain-containing protein [Lachnospiraceae bacterium]|nr:EAL domain-containing protein [Lachnospiraceae bacterium]